MISPDKDGIADLLKTIYGKVEFRTKAGCQSYYTIKICKGGFDMDCPFTVRCEKTGNGNSWRVLRHNTNCVHANHLDNYVIPRLTSYNENQARIQLARHLPEKIRQFALGFKFSESNFGTRECNHGGVDAVLSELRKEAEFRHSVYDTIPSVVAKLRNKLVNFLGNATRGRRSKKPRSGSSLRFLLEESQEEIQTGVLGDFISANGWRGFGVGGRPRSDYENIHQYAEGLGVDLHQLKDIIYLPCPTLIELNTHVKKYHSPGSPSEVPQDEYDSKCVTCACFTSLLQIWGVLQARKNMDRLVRMTDGTFGFLNDGDVCLIVTGLIGTHRLKDTQITRRIWVDGYVLCSKGESKWPTLVLTVALKNIWHKNFGESDSLQANYVCIDNSAALREGYMMAQKCRRDVPANSGEAWAPTAPTSFLGCQYHRQIIVIKSKDKYFPLPFQKKLIWKVIQGQRRMNKCPTVECFRTVKNAIVKEWTDLGLHRCVELFLLSSGNNRPLGLFQYGAAGFPGFPMENGTMERAHGMHKRNTSIRLRNTRTQFLNVVAQQLVDADASRMGNEGPSLLVVKDTVPVAERRYTRPVIASYYLMCHETHEESDLDRCEVPQSHPLFSKITYHYRYYATGATKAWLTNKPPYTRQVIGDMDLNRYLSVLVGDDAPFNGDIILLEKFKDRFCLVWMNPTQPMKEKEFYCNCDIFGERNHCAATIFNMDLEHLNGYRMHQWLVPVKPTNRYQPIFVTSSFRSEIMQIKRNDAFHFLWRLSIPDREYLLRIMGFSNIPKGVSSFRYSILVASPLRQFDLTLYCRLPKQMYRSNSWNGAPPPGKNLSPGLKFKGVGLIKWLHASTPDTPEKEMDLTDADQEAGFIGNGHHRRSRTTTAQLRLDPAMQTVIQFFRKSYEDFLLFICSEWVSFDFVYRAEWFTSPDRPNKIRFKVVLDDEGNPRDTNTTQPDGPHENVGEDDTSFHSASATNTGTAATRQDGTAGTTTAGTTGAAETGEAVGAATAESDDDNDNDTREMALEGNGDNSFLGIEDNDDNSSDDMDYHGPNFELEFNPAELNIATTNTGVAQQNGNGSLNSSLDGSGQDSAIHPYHSIVWNGPLGLQETRILPQLCFGDEDG